MKLSIIIPCYNEFSRLPLITFENFIVKNSDYEFCFVNDGSSDKTHSVLDYLRDKYTKNVTVIHLPKNFGKGEAVRQGINYMLENNAPQYLCYADADLSTPLEEVKRIFNIMQEQQELLFVFGSRVSVFGSKISRLSYRHYGGRIIATMIDLVLGLSIYDTQCGIKIFSETLSREIFKRPFVSRWLFDVEIFAKMKLLFSMKELNLVMKEIPVNDWNEMGNSKIRFTDVIKIPFILLGINRKYKIKDTAEDKLQIANCKILPSFDHSSI